jgi:fucose 4-O-acetylase-like acetyltransferase
MPTYAWWVAQERIAVWDNARFIAIALVVLGHSLTKLVPETDSAYVLYVSIYLFHIPLFVFLSGYFSSAEAPTSARIRSVMVDLLIPYVIFESIWSLIHSVQAGVFLFNPLRPSWTLWFLLSLAAWRILLPYLAQLPLPLTLAVVVSVLSGYWSVDQTLSLSRTLAFLPFFVLGYQARHSGVGDWWLTRPSSVVRNLRALAILWMASVVVSVFVLEDVLRAVGFRKLLTADTSYIEAGFDYWFAGAFRLGVFAIATIMVAAFIVLTPRRAMWWTALGGATMTIYLLHSFVLAPLRATDLLQGYAPWWHISAVVVGSIALTVLLAHPLVVRLFQPLTRPQWALGPGSATPPRDTTK